MAEQIAVYNPSTPLATKRDMPTMASTDAGGNILVATGAPSSVAALSASALANGMVYAAPVQSPTLLAQFEMLNQQIYWQNEILQAILTAINPSVSVVDRRSDFKSIGG